MVKNYSFGRKIKKKKNLAKSKGTKTLVLTKAPADVKNDKE